MMLIFLIFVAGIITIPFFILSSLPAWAIVLISLLIAFVSIMLFPFIVDWIEKGKPVYIHEEKDYVSQNPVLSKRQPCPDCNGRNVAEILYGMVSMTPKLQKLIEKKQVLLGGCMVSDGLPQWHCFDCKKDFGSMRINLPKNTE